MHIPLLFSGTAAITDIVSGRHRFIAKQCSKCLTLNGTLSPNQQHHLRQRCTFKVSQVAA
jgi:hypothetical protein